MAVWTALLVLLHDQGGSFAPAGLGMAKEAPNIRNSILNHTFFDNSMFLTHLGKEGFPNIKSRSSS